jgi:ATP-dependent Lon protease
LTNHTGISEFSNIRDAEPDQDGMIECALVPLSNLVIYPRIVTSISASQPKALAAIQAGQRKRHTVIGVAQRDPDSPATNVSDLFSIGTEMALGSPLPMPDSSLSVLVQGRQRVEITSVVRSAPYMIVKARPLAEFTEQSDESIEALMQTAVEMFSQVADMSPRISDEVQLFTLNIDNPGWLADVIASSLMLSLEERQMLIETLDTGRRLERVITLLNCGCWS